MYACKGSGKSSKEKFVPTRPGIVPSGTCNTMHSFWFNIHDLTWPLFFRAELERAWLLTILWFFLSDLVEGVWAMNVKLWSAQDLANAAVWCGEILLCDVCCLDFSMIYVNMQNISWWRRFYNTSEWKSCWCKLELSMSAHLTVDVIPDFGLINSERLWQNYSSGHSNKPHY